MPSTCTRLGALFFLACVASRAAAFDAGQWSVPPGFAVTLYAQVDSARKLVLSGSSTLGKTVITYVASTGTAVTALVDVNGDGKVDWVSPILSNVSTPASIAWYKGSLLVAQGRNLWQLANVDSYALKKQVHPAPKKYRDDLPPDGWHGLHIMELGPDGKLYMAIGQPCNVCERGRTFIKAGCPTCTLWQFGSIVRMAPLGGNGSPVEVYASGVRNSVGMAFHPDSSKLFFSDNGRDDIGGSDVAITNNSPDCKLLYAPKAGLDFGFPYCHTGAVGGLTNRPYQRAVGVGANIVDPNQNAGEKMMKCNGPALKFQPAIQAMGPHTAPLGIAFYRWTPSSQFPKYYDRSLFIAQHGSWNRQQPIGYRVMRVVLDHRSNATVAQFQAFLTGGLAGDKMGDQKSPPPKTTKSTPVNGRPVDVLQLPDGSLLVSDDSAGAVYRVTYDVRRLPHCTGAAGERPRINCLPGCPPVLHAGDEPCWSSPGGPIG